jgi:hypothetical protein
MQKEIKDKLLENPLNKVCFDCSTKDPEWASVNNGVFLCKDCQVKHRSFGVSVSYIRSLEMDLWKEDQINLLRLGGNEKLRDLMSIYNIKFNTERSELFNSKLLDYHRKLLRAELKGEIRPQPPSDEDALGQYDKNENKLFTSNDNINNNDNVNSNSGENILNNNSNQQYNINESNNNVNHAGSTNDTLNYSKGVATEFAYGLWNTTKDVASNVKNKIDETGISEKVYINGQYYTEKAFQTGEVVIGKTKEYGSKGLEIGKDLGSKGIEISKNKIEEFVSFYYFRNLYYKYIIQIFLKLIENKRS